MSQQKKIKTISTFTGYKNYRDILKLQPTDLIAGSQNVNIEDGAKLEVRAGTQFFGEEGTMGTLVNPSWTLPNIIHSSYDDFVNNQGTKLPIRFYYSGTTTKGDVADVWLNDFDSSGNPLTTKKWYQITANTPATPINSKRQITFTQWFDPLNKQNQLVFVSGNTTVNAWSGGYAPITAVTPTTIKTVTTWRSLGFIESPEGSNTVVVNGTRYTITSGDFSTDTITVASTTGITVSDVAFQEIRFDTIDDQTTPTSFVADNCSTIDNQVYYLDFRQKKGLVSWNRNRASEYGSTNYLGTSGLNDALITGNYTGTATRKLELTIDSVTPGVNNQFYTGTGANDATIDVSGYNLFSQKNTYRVAVVANFRITLSTGSASWVAGEVVIGNTSGAIGRLVHNVVSGILYLEMISGSFVAGETVQGRSSSTTGSAIQCIYQTAVQTYKNSNPFTPTGFTPAWGYIFDVNNHLLIDGVGFTIGGVVGTNWTGHNVGDYWEVTIQNPINDTFSVSLDGVPVVTNIGITGATQSIIAGMSVLFQKTRGHDFGDKWTIMLYPKVDRGWRQVYYTKPMRLPGEGFSFSLDSNGWSLMPQEDKMYINGQGGEYYVADTKLSADLTTETITVKRLKSEPQNKLLFPYLWGYLKDYLGVISQDKTFDLLGRQKFVELPQSKSISDPVRFDFETADWEDASILYFKRKYYFCLPREGKIFIYDDYRKYWHTPHVFARRISRLAIIDNKLIGHSYERNESYELYKGKNDLGLFPIETRIVSSYQSEGYTYDKKSTSTFACAGYIEGVPEIKWQVNFGIGGCLGNRNGVINPVFCSVENTASLGKSSLGYHGLGNDPVPVIPSFLYGKTFSEGSYYHKNFEFYCNSMDQRWSLTSYGINVEGNRLTNADIFPDQV